MPQIHCTNVYSFSGPNSRSQKVPNGATARLLAVLVLAGSLELQADGSYLTIRKHDFIAACASQKYDLHGSDYMAIVIDTPYTSFSSGTLAMLALLRGRTVSLQQDRLPIMSRLMEIALLCACEERYGKREAFLSGILALAISLASDTRAASDGGQDTHAFGPAPAFLLLAGKNIRRHHSVAYYADALNVTPGHLNRTVKAALGLTAKGCLESILFSEARVLLGDPGFNIAEVSDILHFSHPAVFIRFFRRLSGTTPLRYRAGS